MQPQVQASGLAHTPRGVHPDRRLELLYWVACGAGYAAWSLKFGSGAGGGGDVGVADVVADGDRSSGGGMRSGDTPQWPAAPGGPHCRRQRLLPA